MVEMGGLYLSGVLSGLLTAMAVSKSLRQLVIQRQEGECAECGEQIGNRLEIHHKMPRAYGGSNAPGNLVGLCGEDFNDCHDFWDKEALQHQRLPDGTPLTGIRIQPKRR